MPGCDLCASGSDFQVNVFLAMSTWRKSAQVFLKGDSTGSAIRPLRKYSGLRIDLTGEDALLEPQLNAIVEFVKRHADELKRLVNFPGVDEIEFRIGLYWYEDTACYPLTLPPEFLAATGDVGIPVTLYVYAASRDEEQA